MGLLLFIIGIVASAVVFNLPIDIWYGPGFWAAAGCVITVIVGLGMTLHMLSGL